MGGINFGWLAVWVLIPDWLSRQLEVPTFSQALRWNRHAWGRGERAVPRLCILYSGISLTTEENLSQGNRKALGWSALNVIRFKPHNLLTTLIMTTKFIWSHLWHYDQLPLYYLHKINGFITNFLQFRSLHGHSAYTSFRDIQTHT